MDGESFIGGLGGGFLARGFRIGYGVYFTTRRLIGVDPGRHSGVRPGTRQPIMKRWVLLRFRRWNC